MSGAPTVNIVMIIVLEFLYIAYYTAGLVYQHQPGVYSGGSKVGTYYYSNPFLYIAYYTAGLVYQPGVYSGGGYILL